MQANDPSKDQKQNFFTEQLILALQKVQLDDKDSIDHYSSIFTDNNQNDFFERKINQSEGERFNSSPIRDSILESPRSRRNSSTDHHRVKQRS
jgi:hypothetical protein